MKQHATNWRTRWHRVSKTTRIVILGVIVLLVAARIALPHIVQRYVNDKLDELPGYGGSIGDVGIHLWRGAYSIHDINIVKKTNQVPVPFIEADKLEFSVQWKELRHGAVVGEVEAFRARLNFAKGAREEENQTGIDKSWTEVVEDLFPFKINRVALHESEVWFHDFGTEPRVDIFVTNLTFVCSNITNSRSVTNELPTPFQVSGVTIGGGRLNVQGGINPFAESPRFDVDAAIEEMDLVALNDFLRAYANVDVKRGSIELFAEMAAADGRFKGYVKPLVQDLDMVELKEAKEPLRFLWEALVAGVAKLFKNQPKDQLGARVPIEGDLEDLQAGILPTIASVLRNAFVKALAPTVEDRIDIDSPKREEEKGNRPPPQKDTRKD